MSAELDISLVLDSQYRKKYHHIEIENLVKSKHNIKEIYIDKSACIDEADTSSRSKFTSKGPYIIDSIIRKEFSVIIEIERHMAKYLKPSTSVLSDYLQLAKRENVFESISGLDNIETRYFEPIKKSDHTYEFPQEIVDRIVEQTDVVVLLGYSKILRGDILTEPTYGTLSFHWSDFTKYRGRPGGFFQWINDEEEIGMTLQQLTEDLDGGKVVICKHTSISDANSWTDVQLQSIKMYDDILVEGLNKLADPDFTLESPKLGKLTYEKEGEKLQNVIKCVLKNVKNRYFW